jgi:hypothetical protein
VNLAERLHSLAELVERGEVPDANLEGLERALQRAERNAWIAIACRHAGSCADLLRALERERWRVGVWAARGRCPPHVGPLLTALYNAAEAAPLPTSAKQLRRIVQGHDMSLDCAFTDA